MEWQKLDHMSILGEKMKEKSSKLPIHVLDTAASSQDGLSLKFVVAAAAKECNIQEARGGGLCKISHAKTIMLI